MSDQWAVVRLYNVFCLAIVDAPTILVGFDDTEIELAVFYLGMFHCISISILSKILSF